MTTTPPARPADQQWFDRTLLTDATRCPACAARLRGPRCHSCGLQLAGPGGAELWDVSRQAAHLLDRRARLLATMRRATADEARAPETVRTAPPTGLPPAAEPRPAPALAPDPAPGTSQTPALPAYPRPDAPVPQRDAAWQPGAAWQPARPRASWPLQNVLLGLGALLLAGASIVFLAFTWGVMPLALRATVIAVVTAAVFAAATAARRKDLSSSADAIAALGSLLVVLDAWALHATGLVPQPDGATYASLAALGSAGALVGLGTVLRLDVPRVVGCVLLPGAPLVLALDAPSVSVGALLVLLAVVTCGLQLTSWCERRAVPVLRVLALVLLLLALLVTAAALLVDGLLAGAGVLVVVSLVAYGGARLLPAPGMVWPVVAGSAQTLAVACAVLALSGDVPSTASLWLAPLGTLAGAASVSLVARLVTGLAASAPAAGWILFFATTAVPAQAVVVLALATVTTTSPASAGSVLWAALAGVLVAVCGSLLHPVLRPAPAPAHGAAPDAAHPVGPLGAPAPSRFAVPHGRRLDAAPWFSALLLLGSALPLANPSALVGYWLLVPLLLVLLARRRLPREWTTALRAACWTGTGLAIVLSAALAAGGSPLVSARHGGLLLAASLGVLALVLVVARSWLSAPSSPSQRSRADLLLAALVVGAAASGTATGAATGELGASAPGSLLPLVLLALGLVTLAGRPAPGSAGSVVVRTRAVPVADLRAVLAAVAVVGAVTVLVSAASPGGWLVPGDAPPLWLAVLALTGATLLAGLAGLLALGRVTFLSPGLVTASAAATPPLAVLAALTVRPLVPDAAVLWEIIGLVVVAFFPVVAAVLGPRADRARTAMETSALALGGLVLVVVAARQPTDVMTVALAVAAVATAAWAVMPGRARAGWFALALATGSSWTSLASGGIGTLEAYSAPVALAVAAVGVWNVRRSRPAGRHQLLAGTAVLVMPTALLAPGSSQWRSLAVVAVLVLVAAGVLVAEELRRRPSGSVAGHDDLRLTTSFLVLGLFVAAYAVTGRAVVLVGAWSARYGRGTAFSGERARALLSDATAEPGVWVVLAAVTVGGFSWLLGRHWPWTAAAGPRSWGASLTALAITVPTWGLVVGGSVGTVVATWTVLSLVVLWGAVALLGTPPGLPRVTSRAEFLRRAVPPLVAAYVVALALGYTTQVPADLVLTLVGLFVAVVSVRAAVLEPGLRTWRTVGYGVWATVAPVTLALMGAPEGWRVALGVLVASGWLVAGLRLHWQAPVAIGGGALVLQVVVLVGPLGLATLTGVPGWVVLAATGLVLLVLGLTYERQIQTARATLRRYAELR